MIYLVFSSWIMNEFLLYFPSSDFPKFSDCSISVMYEAQ
jgi:hypothetical protein